MFKMTKMVSLLLPTASIGMIAAAKQKQDKKSDETEFRGEQVQESFLSSSQEHPPYKVFGFPKDFDEKKRFKDASRAYLVFHLNEPLSGQRVRQQTRHFEPDLLPIPEEGDLSWKDYSMKFQYGDTPIKAQLYPSKPAAEVRRAEYMAKESKCIKNSKYRRKLRELKNNLKLDS